MSAEEWLSQRSKITSPEQLEFIKHPINNSCFLKACPGSGKTECVGIKLAYEIDKWKEKFNGIAALSFTKNAANEIEDRVKKLSLKENSLHPHYIGTFDSWIHRYLLHPFAHSRVDFVGKNNDKSFRLIGSKEKPNFILQLRTVIASKPKYKDLWVNEYYFEQHNKHLIIFDSEGKVLNSSIGLLDQKELKDNKGKFFRMGFLNYNDAEYLSHRLLTENNGIAKSFCKRFPVIIIDECQDLSGSQLNILKLLRDKGVTIHFVGDMNQSIYEFRKVDVKMIQSFVYESQMNVKQLTKNYRSNQNIVDICCNLASIIDNANSSNITGTQSSETRSCILWQYSPEFLPQLPQIFQSYIESRNMNISLEKSVILARNHAILNKMRNSTYSIGSNAEILLQSLLYWTHSSDNVNLKKDSLTLLGRFLSKVIYDSIGNRQHQFCPDEYSFIEWRTLLVNMITNMVNSQSVIFPFKGIRWATWCEHVREHMISEYPNFRAPLFSVKEMSNRIKTPIGLTKQSINIADSTTRTSNLRLTTFHDIKGETVDAALIVSTADRKSKGGHCEHWISHNADDKEFVRFAYVASSRPKYLLIWAVPKFKTEEYSKEILNLGFVLEDMPVIET